MDEMEFKASNFMPKDLIEIICILMRGEKCHSYKIIPKRSYSVVSLSFEFLDVPFAFSVLSYVLLLLGLLHPCV